MTLPFILNGEDVVARVRSGDRLSEVLRESFKLLGVHSDCRCGRCGRCLVLLDGKLVPSCIVPAFRVRGREIVTIEGYAQTNEYQDLVAGFKAAGIETCGFCDSGKMLAAGALLEHRARPMPQEILEQLSAVPCRCTDAEALVKAVQAAADFRARRHFSRGH